MLKFLASSLFHLLIIFDKILKIFKKDSLADFIFNKIQSDKYNNFSVVKIGDKKLKLVTSNGLLKLRVDTFFTKEPETLNWINQFDQTFKSFWDIGANVGLYSLYASIKHSSKEIVCFEPSFNNLKVLSENISINKLENYIKIFQIGLGDKKKTLFI